MPLRSDICKWICPPCGLFHLCTGMDSPVVGESMLAQEWTSSHDARTTCWTTAAPWSAWANVGMRQTSRRTTARSDTVITYCPRYRRCIACSVIIKTNQPNRSIFHCFFRIYEVGTLAVDGWAVTFGTARRGLGGLRPLPPRPLLAVLNVTANPSTASIPITVLLYDGPLLCAFNVAIKGLNLQLHTWTPLAIKNVQIFVTCRREKNTCIAW